MKYSALIVCAVHGALPLIELDATEDTEAVDKARALHVVPDEGGDYTISVTCLESVSVPKKGGGFDTRPAGASVSEFGVTHEPAEHVAVAVRARKAEAEAAALAAEERERIRAEYRAELEAAGQLKVSK